MGTQFQFEHEIFNTINTKTLVPNLLIWSRAGQKPKKLVLGPYSTTWSYISLAYNKNMADEEKYIYAFRRRVYNLHLIQISAQYMPVW